MNTFPAVEAFRGGTKLIKVVGHRGARGILPENSMIGFTFAMSAGVPLLEFDVMMTSDLVPVITHNYRLHSAICRGKDGDFLKNEPKVSSLSWSDTQAFDIGKIDGESAYGKRFPERAQLDNIRVPRLTDLLHSVSQPQFAAANLMLEIKSDPDFIKDTAYRKKLVGIIISQVRSAGLAERTLLHSFDWDILSECQHQAPDIPVSFLTELPQNQDEIGEDSAKLVSPDFSGCEAKIPEMVKAAGGSVWCPNVNDVTDSNISLAKNIGLCIAVWTVNNIEDIDRMIDLEVDAIVTDYPGRVQRRLSDRGFCWQS